jgi:hypothetical protein
MVDAVHADAGPLWAITSYFNPAGYARRRMNYHVFRRRLGVPLVAIELSFHGRFELTSRDAEIVLRRTGGDVLWQKERLLNLALAALPADCLYVVWVDCDVVFCRDDWADETIARLATTPLLQPYSTVHALPAGAIGGRLGPSQATGERPGVASVISGGGDLRVLRDISRRAGSRANGYAWATRRELLERHGFYDACIVGGGDTALVCAALGDFEAAIDTHAMNEWQQERYLHWSQPFFASVQRVLSFVPGGVLHLWHGDVQDRRSRQRHLDLRPFNFNPASDLALTETGVWRWNSDKPALHSYVRDYFAGRNEDGLHQRCAAA